MPPTTALLVSAHTTYREYYLGAYGHRHLETDAPSLYVQYDTLDATHPSAALPWMAPHFIVSGLGCRAPRRRRSITTRGRKMLTRSQALIFVTGGFGGMAPSLFDLAEKLRAIPPDIPGWAYAGSLLILMTIGGGVALAFKETNYLKALLLGLTLPALVASYQSSRDIPTGSVINDDKAASLLGSFVSSALAQSNQTIRVPVSPVADWQQENGSSGYEIVRGLNELEIVPQKRCTKCWLWFYNNNGELVARIPFNSEGDGDGTYTFRVPEQADKFGIWNKLINPYLWDLPQLEDNGSPSFDFDYNYNPWKDFMRGFGYNWKSYDPEVKSR